MPVGHLYLQRGRMDRLFKSALFPFDGQFLWAHQEIPLRGARCFHFVNDVPSSE